MLIFLNHYGSCGSNGGEKSEKYSSILRATMADLTVDSNHDKYNGDSDELSALDDKLRVRGKKSCVTLPFLGLTGKSDDMGHLGDESQMGNQWAGHIK